MSEESASKHKNLWMLFFIGLVYWPFAMAVTMRIQHGNGQGTLSVFSLVFVALTLVVPAVQGGRGFLVYFAGLMLSVPIALAIFFSL
ncbi:MAG: hypothetical protein AAB299_09565, partial [Thermodesulfobacteriota bacterium]